MEPHPILWLCAPGALAVFVIALRDGFRRAAVAWGVGYALIYIALLALFLLYLNDPTKTIWGFVFAPWAALASSLFLSVYWAVTGGAGLALGLSARAVRPWFGRIPVTKSGTGE